jgi:hypothetical protein
MKINFPLQIHCLIEKLLASICEWGRETFYQELLHRIHFSNQSVKVQFNNSN